MPIQVSILVLVIAVAVSVIGTFVITLFIGIILVLLCGMKWMPKKLKKTKSKEKIDTPEENVMETIKGPIYEEVELIDETGIIDFSQNIAYGNMEKTAS